MRRIFVLMLALACFLTGPAFAENTTIEQLLISDTWVFTHDHQNYIRFAEGGTGETNGFAMTWQTSLFGVTAECEVFGSKITASYNLISENGVPVLQLSDGSSYRLMRRCDLDGGQAASSVAAEAAADNQAQETVPALSREQVLQLLTGEAWTEPAPDGNTYTFAADGTGKMDLGSGYVLDTTWTLEDSTLTLKYNLYGERMLICTLNEEEGVYKLNYGESSFLVRESDAQALILASRSNMNAYAVAAGEPVSLGFTNLSFENAMNSRKVVGSSKSGIVLPEKPGCTYLTVLGSIKNNTGSEISMRNLRAEIHVDNAYTYSASVAAEIGEQLKYALPAQASGKLYISAELPADVAANYTAATVYLSFNDDFASAPKVVAEGSYIFSFALTDELIAASKLGPIRKLEYFEECPVLPMPSSYADVRNAGRSSSSRNGKITRLEYSFSCEFDGDSIDDLLTVYKNALATEGFTLKNGDVYAGKTKVASLSVKNNKISINIVPGNEKLKFTPTKSAAPVVVEEEPIPEEVTYTLGQTLKLDTMQMSLNKTGTGTIYSSVTKRRNGFYQYYEGTHGNEIFYLTGTFKNLGSVPVDIRNIYAEFTFDGKYTYRGDVEGAAPDANMFIEDISPRGSVTYYAFAQIPKDVLSSYKTCTARIGFTDGFSTKFVTSGGLPNFDYCNDVFNINLTKGAKPSSGSSSASSSSSSASGSSASGYQTLKPGSKGQAVLDARMKLYELGYFNKKPTQKEYTNNMKDYVKKFERDHGLTQDGILSPEDQEVLFSL